MAVKISTKDPAPKWWRKFENGYIMVLVPSMITAVQTWGLSDKVANRAMILITISAAIAKFIGFLIANGETYQQSYTAPKDAEKQNGNG